MTWQGTEGKFGRAFGSGERELAILTPEQLLKISRSCSWFLAQSELSNWRKVLVPHPWHKWGEMLNVFDAELVVISCSGHGPGPQLEHGAVLEDFCPQTCWVVWMESGDLEHD